MGDAVDAFLAEVGCALPDEYIALLRRDDVRRLRDQDTGKRWRLLTVPQLREVVEIHPAPPTPRYRALRAYAVMLESAGVRSQRPTGGTGRLGTWLAERSFVIAEDNGDLLFLRLDDSGSVWCFWHDGADVQRLAECLDELSEVP